MSQRKLPALVLSVAALVFAAFGLTGGPWAGAATSAEPKPGKPGPAVPKGPKATFDLDQFGPRLNDNVALKWSEQTLALIRRSSLPPTVVSRVLAIVQTSVYDAWAAYDPVAVGTQWSGSLRRPASEHDDAAGYKSKAISYAAYRALQDLFPDDASHKLLKEFMTELKYDPNDTTEDVNTAAGIGNVAARAVLDARKYDGSNQYPERKEDAPYSDTSGYQPVNTSDTVNFRWRWQPLHVNGKPQTFATPHWGNVTPFALSRPNQFVVPGPDLRKDYKKAVHEVVQFSAKLTDTDKATAEYWADGPRTELPPGHNAIFAAALCRKAGNNIDNDVKMLFLQANAVLDAGIAAWHYKVEHDFVRPVTLVRELYRGQKIRAWGGPYKGTVSMLGEKWQPYQPATFVTPPFAEYVSGHSTFSAASFEVLRSFTGSDALNLSVTIKKGSSKIEPPRDTPYEPGEPSKDIKLTWPTMQAAADNAGLSRRYGGIHFSEGDLHGRALGTRIGQAVYQKAQRYFTGKAQ
jgi:hypothetical protein